MSVVYINFIREWWNLQLNVYYEWQIFEKLFFYCQKNFCQKSVEKKWPKKYFFSNFIWFEISDLGFVAWLSALFLHEMLKLLLWWLYKKSTWHLSVYTYIHTYIIDHYNPSVRIVIWLLSPLMLCVLIFYISRETYSLKSTLNDRFLRIFFMTI